MAGNEMIEHDDPLNAFAARPVDEQPSSSMIPTGNFGSPGERVHGAQPVAVKRDERQVLANIKTLSAMAGEAFYWRWQVNQKDPETNKYVKVWIDGPSIKCANNVARLYGNCDVDCRLAGDTGTHWLFYARFMDLETGYALTRPFNQRKGQKAMKTDAGRAEDMIFQVGTSKAIRNVVNNALEFYTNFAKEEAKNSIIERVGRQIDKYKQRVVDRLAEMEILLRRVEAVRGKPIKDWIASEVTYTIAEIQAINDGMATAEETYPPLDSPAAAETVIDKTESDFKDFAEGDKPAASTASAGPSPAAEASAPGGAAPKQAAAGTGAPTENAAAAAQPPDKPAETAKPAETKVAETKTAEPKPAAKKAADKPPADPTTEAAYVAWANGWREALTSADDGEKRWKAEKPMRNKCNVEPGLRDELEKKLRAKCVELRKGGAP